MYMYITESCSLVDHLRKEKKRKLKRLKPRSRRNQTCGMSPLKAFKTLNLMVYNTTNM